MNPIIPFTARSVLSVSLAGLFVCMTILLSGERESFGQSNEGPMTPEREAAALTFAGRHHPELVSLLNQLKQRDAKKYQAATTELFRTSERLARYQDRQPDRYQTELETWKIDSRVRLLVARSVKGMEEETRQQVRELLMQRNDLRREQLIRDRDKLQERVARMNEQIVQLKDENATLADRELDRLLRTANGRRPAKTAPSSESPAASPSKPSRESSQTRTDAKPQSRRREPAPDSST